MSQEHNLELTRRAFAGFGKEDISGLWAEDCVIIPPDGWPEAEPVFGIEAWRRQLERLEDSWDETHIEIDTIDPLDDERVLTTFRYVATGKGSGIPMAMPMGSIHTVRDGLVVHTQFFNSPEEARAAAELRD